jgi:hypothetical protein
MARLAKVILPGYPHHIIQRGNRRQDALFCEDDYTFYLDLLTRANSVPTMTRPLRLEGEFNFRSLLLIVAKRFFFMRFLSFMVSKGFWVIRILTMKDRKIEVATLVGVNLFEYDNFPLSRQIEQTRDKVALLPKRIKSKTKVVDDDF